MGKLNYFFAVAMMTTLTISGINKVKDTMDKYPDAKIQNRAEKLKHLMSTSNGKPLVADVDSPIGIFIQDATDAEKEEIIEAVEDMNEICPNLDYTIIDNYDLKLENYIKINMVEDITEHSNVSSNSLGCAEVKYNQNTAKILYPTNIYIDTDVSNVFDSEDGTSLLSFIVKHELMHTLGFKDLYNEEYLNQSVMYYEIGYKTNITDFTDFDKTNLNYIYGDTKIRVERPNKLVINKQNEVEYEL